MIDCGCGIRKIVWIIKVWKSLTLFSENFEVKSKMAEDRKPGDGFGHRFGFAAFKKMRRLNKPVQGVSVPSLQVFCMNDFKMPGPRLPKYANKRIHHHFWKWKFTRGSCCLTVHVIALYQTATTRVEEPAFNTCFIIFAGALVSFAWIKLPQTHVGVSW